MMHHISPRGMPRRKLGPHLVAAVLIAVAGLAAPTVEAQRADGGGAAVSSYSEDEVKAAFLYNFANYVEWPNGGNGPITFALFGAPSVEDALERFVQGRTLQGRPIRVRRVRSISELDGDNIVFIGSDENGRLRQLISSIAGPTLVVTDAPDGLADGSMINFQIIDRRVRFEIALPAAEEAGLMLSSRLLSAALRVETSYCDLRCWESERRPPLYSFDMAELPAFVVAGAAAGDVFDLRSASARIRIVVEIETKT